MLALTKSRLNNGKPEKANPQGTFDLAAGLVPINDPVQQLLLGNKKEEWGVSVTYDPPKSLALKPGEMIVLSLAISSDGKVQGYTARFDSDTMVGATGYAKHTLLPPLPGPGQPVARGSVSQQDRPYNPHNTMGPHTEHLTFVAVLQSKNPVYNVILGCLEFDFYDELGKAKITVPNQPGGAIVIAEATTKSRTVKGIAAQADGADLDTALGAWNSDWK